MIAGSCAHSFLPTMVKDAPWGNDIFDQVTENIYTLADKTVPVDAFWCRTVSAAN